MIIKNRISQSGITIFKIGTSLKRSRSRKRKVRNQLKTFLTPLFFNVNQRQERFGAVQQIKVK
jgi:hypothetical protein